MLISWNIIPLLTYFVEYFCNLLSICFTNMRKNSFSMHIFGNKLTNTCVCFHSELAKLLFICSLIMMMNKSLSFHAPTFTVDRKATDWFLTCSVHSAVKILAYGELHFNKRQDLNNGRGTICILLCRLPLDFYLYKGKSSLAFYLTAITAFPLSLAKEQDAGWVLKGSGTSWYDSRSPIGTHRPPEGMWGCRMWFQP